MIRDRDRTKTFLSIGSKLFSKLDIAVLLLQGQAFASADLHCTYNAITKSVGILRSSTSALQQHAEGDFRNEK